LFAYVLLNSREEGVRRHISGNSETPLKNYDVTEFYSKILRTELIVLQNTGAASAVSSFLFACHIKQLVKLISSVEFCELYSFRGYHSPGLLPRVWNLYSFRGYRSQGLLPRVWNPSTMTYCQFPFFFRVPCSSPSSMFLRHVSPKYEELNSVKELV
jgi:hypothetical protein